MGVVTEELREGILLTCDASDPLLHIFLIENKKPNLFTFIVNFTGSVDVTVPGSEGLVVTADVPPFAKAEIARARVAPGGRVVYMMQLIQKPVPSGVKQPTEEQADSSDSALRESSESLQKQLITDADPAALTTTQPGHFVDPYFLHNESTIYDGMSVPHDLPVQYRRPEDFFSGPLGLIDSDVHPSEIKQGLLGDGWFVSALASLAERKILVKRLFATESVSPEGVYRFRFCKGGEWQEVTVDDYIPCTPLAGPVFSQSHANELWVLLVEKAYAKLHGSYFLLQGGWVHEGIMDLTGYPIFFYDFEKSDVREMYREGYFWHLLRNYHADGSLISASTPGENRWVDNRRYSRPGALVAGNAYPVIQVREAYGNRLLNIRNPWGVFEWDGDWSDISPKWTASMKSAIKPALNGKDGTFWMSYSDFINHFQSVTICLVKDYQEKRIKGLFVKTRENSDAEQVCSRWYYTLEVDKPTRIFIGVHQDDERIIGVAQTRPYLDMGIAILEWKDGCFKLNKRKENASTRQVQMEALLKPGRRYFVVPRTSGCVMQRSAGSYPPEPLKDGESPTPLLKSTLKDIFRKANIEISEELSYPEFSLMMTSANFPISEPDFSQLLSQYPSTSMGLTLEGFTDFFRDKANQLGEVSLTQPTVRGWLKKWGYDDDLFASESRCFVLTIQSQLHDMPELSIEDSKGSNIDQIASNLILQRFGTLKSKVQNAALYQVRDKCELHSEANLYLLGVHNESSQSLVATLDMSRSTGMDYSCNTSTAKKKVEAKGWETLMQCQVQKEAQSCAFRTSLSVSEIPDT